MNDVDFLHPLLRKKYFELVELCKESDIGFYLETTYRSKYEQNRLYTKGRLIEGEIETEAKYPNNYHCWGLAFDISPDDFEIVAIVVNNAKKLGLTWGMDNDDTIESNLYHFELPLESLKNLRLKYANYSTYRDTWNADYKQPSMITKEIMDNANKQTMYIGYIQNACQLDKFDYNRQIVMVTNKLDKPTMGMLNNLKFVDNKYYNLIAVCQKILKRLGYNISTDGIANSVTKAAIKKFAIQEDIAATDILNADIIVHLLAKL